MQFASRIATNHPPKEIQALADAVSSHEIELEAAVFSMRTRLRAGDPTERAFGDAREALVASWMTAGQMIEMHPDQRPGKPFRDWEAAHDRFREAFDDAMDEARRVLGGRSRLRGRDDAGEREHDR
jgi:hypothetical protein